MSTTLQTYITQVQRLLHDTSASFWPIAELTDYINAARARIANDTKCLRQLVTSIPLTTGVELYNVQATVALAPVPMLQSVVDILGISLYWGNTRFKLNYMSFSQFDAYVRAWQLYKTRPVIFTRMGGLNVYLGPVPDQAYITDWDVAIEPAALVNSTDVDPIPPPFNAPVQYWAAHLAKFKEQSYGEAEMFKKEYTVEGIRAQRVFMTRVLPNPYSM
jgi:hypothetical protein